MCVYLSHFLSFFLEVNSEQYIYVLKYAKKNPQKPLEKTPTLVFWKLTLNSIYVYMYTVQS